MVNGMVDAAKLLGNWNGYMWFAAGRYEMPGKADREDLYQAACIGLMEAVKHLPETLTIESEDFSRLAKTAIWNNVLDVVRPFLTQGRNYHLEVSGNVSLGDRDLFASELFSVLPDLRSGNPARLASMHEIVGLIRKELSHAPKALALFDNMIDPDAGIVESYRIHEKSLSSRTSGEHRGTHNAIGVGIPLPIFADVLKLTMKEARTALRKVREAASKVMCLDLVKYPATA